MRVIPIRADLFSDEAVSERTSDRHSILGHPGYAVHRIRDVDTVPVQRDTIGDRFVAQLHLDQLTLQGPDLRAG